MAEAESKVVYVTEESLRRKELAEQRATARAKALEGLKFPLLVVNKSNAVIFYQAHRVRPGRTFTCQTAAEYSPTTMAPAKPGSVDQVEQARRAAPPRAKRSGEGGDPPAPHQPQPTVLSQVDSGKNVL